ncbi:MAG: 5-methylthioadenosine phosphorylase [Eubacteriales bacterium]|nr:5-methylthioadenosine phosphorylase [Eubacteriales bacterium]
MTADIAIIGGTGLYQPELLEEVGEMVVETEYGPVSLKTGKLKGKRVAFLARHGEKHTIPPHLINYRANICALQKIGVKRVLATAATGSLNLEMEPGHMVIINQFIDFTKNRPSTFFDDGREVVHVDMTEPYCPELRRCLIKAARQLGLPHHPGGTYVCTEGPRFETPAEIRAYQLLGGHVVGMTNVPEVVLAREAEICYATVAVVTNYAAGISPHPLTHQEVLDAMAKNNENLRRLVLAAIDLIPEERGCECGQALGRLGQLTQK